MAFGINFFGPIYSEDGIGEAARLTLQCFQESGIDIAINPLSRPVAREENIEDVEFVTPYSINYFHFSSRWVPHYMEKIGLENIKNKYNIGYWVTEVQEYPEEWAKNFKFFDEIWTASSFCQDSISQKIPIPTLLISHPIVGSGNINISKVKNRKKPFIFLVMANAYSDIERKNVLASLLAFQKAFDNKENVELIIKLSNSDSELVYVKKIMNLINADARIKIIDKFIDRLGVDKLFHSVDAYVSLHRSEGFGLTLGEAMYYGIPVITTAYSGNMDFCNQFNSYLVDYDLVQVGEDRLRYKSTDLWAEPKIDSAVKAFIKVYSDPMDVMKKTQEAKKFITQHFSIQTIGQKISKRLELINTHFKYSEENYD